MRTGLVVFTGVLLAAAAHGVAAGPEAFSDPAVEHAMSQIRPEGLRAHIRFLADDLLEGRGTGTRGYDLAAGYLAAQFAALGLEPAGADGSYLQPVPLLQAQAVAGESAVHLLRNGQEEKLEPDKEVVVLPDYSREASSVTAPVVFVLFLPPSERTTPPLRSRFVLPASTGRWGCSTLHRGRRPRGGGSASSAD
jgi:hypothetical protein